MRISSIGLAAVAALAVSGCAYNGLGMGVGYGSGYGPYGYGYDPYYGATGARYYGYGYGSPYGYGSRYGYGYSPYGYAPYGWYNGYYYPGSGYYVYDRDRNRRRMTDAERAYWQKRVAGALASKIRENRGETVGTSSTAATSQQVVRAPTRTVQSAPSRERVRSTVSSRIQERRTARETTRSSRRRSD